MIKDSDVVNAFFWLLGRHPENEAVIKHFSASESTDNLRKKLLLTEEFHNQLRLHSQIATSSTWVCADLTKRYGIYLWLDLHDKGVGLPCLTGEYEPIETRFIRHFLNSGDCFVDIGANIGWFTMHAASIVGRTGKVISFEPSPIIYPWTVKSVQDNHFCDIVVLHRCALSEKNSYLLLDRGELTQNPGGSSAVTISDGLSADHKHLIRCVAGDDLIKNNPNLIKIDVEGAELLALTGIKNTINSSHPVIMCEINPQALSIVSKCSVSDLVDFIDSIEYNYFYLEENRLRQLAREEVLSIELPWYNLIFSPKELSFFLSTISF